MSQWVGARHGMNEFRCDWDGVFYFFMTLLTSCKLKRGYFPAMQCFTKSTHNTNSSLCCEIAAEGPKYLTPRILVSPSARMDGWTRIAICVMITLTRVFVTGSLIRWVV